MNTFELSTLGYTHPDIEDMLDAVHKQIIVSAELSGKHEGARAALLTEEHMHAVFVNPVHEQIQSRRYEVDQRLLSGSEILHVSDQAEVADKAIDDITAEHQDHERRMAELTAKNDELNPDLTKIQLAKWFTFVAIVAGFADGILCYSGLHVQYSSIIATIFALTIGGLIAFSHIPGGYWIMSAGTYKQKAVRFLILAVAAAILFFLIAFFRASTANGTISISLSNTAQNHNSPMLIGSISTLLFIAVLACSLYLWRTVKQKNADKEYAGNCIEIERLRVLCDLLTERICTIREEVIQKRRLARSIYEYRDTVLKRLRAIGSEAISKFKSAYSRRRGQTPPFFSKVITLPYDDGTTFSNFKKQ